MPPFLLFAIFCLAFLDSTRALAVESVTLVAEPFAPVANISFSADSRTRVMLFANKLSLLSGATSKRVRDDEVNTLKNIKGPQFEVVKMSNIVTP